MTREDRINDLFGVDRTTGVLAVCPVEAEHPEAVARLRAHLTEHGRYTPTVFDHHPSWGFARATTGWLFTEDPVAYVEAVRQAKALMTHYPDVDVVVHDLGDINFRTSSYYSDTPTLRRRYAQEVAFTDALLDHFPQATYEALKTWLIDPPMALVEAHPSLDDVRPFFVFRDHYGITQEDPQALDAWSEDQGVRGWLGLSFFCNKASAMAVASELESAGFVVKVLRPHSGHYHLHLTLRART